jgi:hypothetical protein
MRPQRVHTHITAGCCRGRGRCHRGSTRGSGRRHVRAMAARWSRTSSSCHPGLVRGCGRAACRHRFRRCLPDRHDRARDRQHRRADARRCCSRLRVVAGRAGGALHGRGDGGVRAGEVAIEPARDSRAVKPTTQVGLAVLIVAVSTAPTGPPQPRLRREAMSPIMRAPATGESRRAVGPRVRPAACSQLAGSWRKLFEQRDLHARRCAEARVARPPRCLDRTADERRTRVEDSP